MASFLYLIKSISTGPLRGIGIFWCLSALCCQVLWASTLPSPMHWQLAYRNEKLRGSSRFLRYERSSKRHPFVSCSYGTAEFVSHIEVQSHIPGQYHPFLAYFCYSFEDKGWLKFLWLGGNEISCFSKCSIRQYSRYFAFNGLINVHWISLRNSCMYTSYNHTTNHLFSEYQSFLSNVWSICCSCSADTTEFEYSVTVLKFSLYITII